MMKGCILYSISIFVLIAVTIGVFLLYLDPQKFCAGDQMCVNMMHESPMTVAFVAVGVTILFLSVVGFIVFRPSGGYYG